MRTSPKQKVLELYDQTADSYSDMMDSEIELPVYSDILSRLADRISSISGPMVDTSCGSGHVLQIYRERYEPNRPVVGIDLSPRMVEIAGSRLGSGARTLVGDMCDLSQFDTMSVAAVLSFYAVHHLNPDEALFAFREWKRVLCPGGQLVVLAWEGVGPIDYGEESEVVALRYTQKEIAGWANDAGYIIDKCVVEPVEGFEMQAVYLEGKTTDAV